MVIFIYNLLFPLIFLFFVPNLILKLVKRTGPKDTYLERFGLFSDEVKVKLQRLSNPVWVHAVSVGETQIAVSFIKLWKKQNPNINFVLSTTTTTGQELARRNAPEDVVVIFCPIDFILIVKKVIKLIKPKILILFETEIWPNLIFESNKAGTKVVQVNARISDHSFKGYYKYRKFISPFLSKLTVSCAQSELDASRLCEICPTLNVVQAGNMKFDQKIPVDIPDIDLKEVFGNGSYRILIGASTHPDEEKLIASAFKSLMKEFHDFRLILIPRHSERGNDVASILKDLGISFKQRSKKKNPAGVVSCLLADTTGEMVSFMDKSEIVIVGKSFTGNDEGQNVIEPALMGKAVITGLKLKNFRHVMDLMKKKNAIISVGDDELEDSIRNLLKDPDVCKKQGNIAKAAVTEHIGATQRTIDIVKKYV